jgi:hypothetical protein
LFGERCALKTLAQAVVVGSLEVIGRVTILGPVLSFVEEIEHEPFNDPMTRSLSRHQ